MRPEDLPLSALVMQAVEAAEARGILPREEYEDAIDELQSHLGTLIEMGSVIATPQERFNSFVSSFANEPEAEQEFIKYQRALPYDRFLKGIYWDIVRSYLRYTRGARCELCGKGGRLNTHHKTYANRGHEFRHLDDLIILCESCHAKFHDKLPKVGG